MASMYDSALLACRIIAPMYDSVPFVCWDIALMSGLDAVDAGI